MRIFTGQYDRTIDAKNRIQMPSQLRAAINPNDVGCGLYITLGSFRGTLSIYTERGFEKRAEELQTEYMPGDASRRFELQFYGLASHVEMDKQGRIVLPERLRRKAKLEESVLLVGQNYRIDVWNRVDLERSEGIDWEGDEWPDWEGFLRVKPGGAD